MRLLILLSALVLISIACSASTGYAMTPFIPATQTPRPPTATATYRAKADNMIVPKYPEMCVVSYGLWLRSSPEIADNKIMALPQGTRVKVVISGIWARVCLTTTDEFGYVRMMYLGECK